MEPYLHGKTDDDFTTEFAWRKEVSLITGKEADIDIAELLNEFPLKPHEILRVPTFGKRGSAVAHLTAIAEREPKLPAWVIEPGGEVAVATLAELAREVSDNPQSLAARTVVLPPAAGGLTTKGTLAGDEEYDASLDNYDVAGTPPAKVEPLLRLLVTPADGGGTVSSVARIADWPITGKIECEPGEKPLGAVNRHLRAAGQPRVRTIFTLEIPDVARRRIPGCGDEENADTPTLPAECASGFPHSPGNRASYFIIHTTAPFDQFGGMPTLVKLRPLDGERAHDLFDQGDEQAGRYVKGGIRYEIRYTGRKCGTRRKW